MRARLRLVFRSLLPVLGAGVVLLPGGCDGATAQAYRTEHGPVRLTTVARGLEHPWGLVWLPDGRMLVTERPGRLRLVTAAGVLSAPLANVPPVYASGQGGLLDVVLDPSHATNRIIYLSYAEPGEGGAGTAVARARLAPGGLEDLRVIFRQAPKVGGGMHFGSRLVFGRDGSLFITTGERNRRAMSQQLDRHQGKVIRIRPDGSVPGDNPFVSRDDARPEIWSYGHRNVQGAALHPETGELWTVEHGAMGGDELNRPQAGRNYGWPVITYGRDYTGRRIGEGTAKPGMEQPVYYWDPSIAPSGMAWYSGRRLPGWQGNLFVTSLKFGILARLELRDGRVVHEERLFGGLNTRLRDVREGPDGLLYLLTDESQGRILRIEPDGS